MHSKEAQQLRKALEEAAKLGQTDDVAKALKSFPTIKHHQHHSELAAHYERLKNQEQAWECGEPGSRDVEADTLSLHNALYSSSENGHPDIVEMVLPCFMYLTASHDTRAHVIQQALLKSSAKNHADVVKIIIPHYVKTCHNTVSKGNCLKKVLEDSSEKGRSDIVKSVLVYFTDPHVSSHTKHAGIRVALWKSLKGRHPAVVEVLLPLLEELDMTVRDKRALMRDAVDDCFLFKDQTLYRLLCPVFSAFSLSEHREHLALYQQVEKSLNSIHEEIGSGVISELQTFISEAVRNISRWNQRLEHHVNEIRSGNHELYMAARTIEQRVVDLDKELEFGSKALWNSLQAHQENTFANDIIGLISCSQGHDRVCHCLEKALCIAIKHDHRRTPDGLLALVHSHIRFEHDRNRILGGSLDIAFQNGHLAVLKLLVPEFLECSREAVHRRSKLLDIIRISTIDGYPDIVALLPKVFPHQSDRIPRSEFLSKALACTAKKGHIKSFVSLLHEFSTSAESYDKWQAGLAEAKEQAKGSAAALSGIRRAESSFFMICQQINIALGSHPYSKGETSTATRSTEES